MLNRILLVFASLGMAFVMSNAQAEKIKGWAEVKFFGASTLHDFEGAVRSRVFEVEVEGDQVDATDLKGVEITVPVKKMDTGNRRMNKNMHKMFEADKHPTITAKLTGISEKTDGSEGGKDVANIQFDIKIREVSKQLRAVVKNIKTSNQEVMFNLELDVSVKAFKLKPPTMLGVLRVGDNVRVEVEIVLKKR